MKLWLPGIPLEPGVPTPHWLMDPTLLYTLEHEGSGGGGSVWVARSASVKGKALNMVGSGRRLYYDCNCEEESGGFRSRLAPKGGLDG